MPILRVARRGMGGLAITNLTPAPAPGGAAGITAGLKPAASTTLSTAGLFGKVAPPPPPPPKPLATSGLFGKTPAAPPPPPPPAPKPATTSASNLVKLFGSVALPATPATTKPASQIPLSSLLKPAAAPKPAAGIPGAGYGSSPTASIAPAGVTSSVTSVLKPPSYSPSYAPGTPVAQQTPITVKPTSPGIMQTLFGAAAAPSPAPTPAAPAPADGGLLSTLFGSSGSTVDYGQAAGFAAPAAAAAGGGAAPVSLDFLKPLMEALANKPDAGAQQPRNWLPWIAGGGAALLVLYLMFRRKGGGRSHGPFGA